MQLPTPALRRRRRFRTRHSRVPTQGRATRRSSRARAGGLHGFGDRRRKYGRGDPGGGSRGTSSTGRTDARRCESRTPGLRQATGAAASRVGQARARSPRENAAAQRANPPGAWGIGVAAAKRGCEVRRWPVANAAQGSARDSGAARPPGDARDEARAGAATSRRPQAAARDYRGGAASSRVSSAPSRLRSCRANVSASACRWAARLTGAPRPPGSSSARSTPSPSRSMRANA
jgi:hypothetical protein